MAKPKAAEIAKREYSKVWYFPFGNKPASPYVLTSNPFAFLTAWLDAEIQNIHKETPKKSRLKKARYFCELSEAFNSSANNSKMPARATPLYYAHLNLVKCYLLINGIDLEKELEHHGLSLPHNYTDKIKFGKKPDEGISIFREFACLMGIDFSTISGTDVSLNELLFELPEIHELGFALNLFQGKRKMLPIRIEIMTNVAHNKLFFEMIYEKKNEKFMGAEKLDKGVYKEMLKSKEENDGEIKYRSKRQYSYNTKSAESWQRAYNKVCEGIHSLGITSILTRDGYRYYLNLSPAKINRYCSVLALMYYIGSVARYRPSLNEAVLKGRHQAILNEAIEACPNQFYYHLVSLMTNSVCAMPMSKI